jgi:2-polyprenyl-3-methyl-5-hydroxy-6-metoxy-1,4-benzoquinol methylase
VTQRIGGHVPRMTRLDVPAVDARLQDVVDLLDPRSVLDLDADPSALDRGGTWDLVVSRTPVETTTSLAELVALARTGMLLGGDRRVADAITQVAPDADVYPLGDLVQLVLLAPTERHRRDLPAARLRELVDDHPNPLRLAQLRVVARDTIRFFPDHEPRVWEYPSVADRVLELVPAGGRVADVGAGVTPLAPFLTTVGYRVDTVDPSPIQRSWPPRPDWNEWDFLDYAQARLAEASWNCTLDQVPADRTYEAVVSVSVVEHLPAQVRRELLGEVARRLEPDGVTVLTVDVERDTTALWNRSRGERVEDPELHGSFDELLAEVVGAGMELVEQQVVRGWGSGPVDIGVVVARSTRT